MQWACISNVSFKGFPVLCAGAGGTHYMCGVIESVEQLLFWRCHYCVITMWHAYVVGVVSYDSMPGEGGAILMAGLSISQPMYACGAATVARQHDDWHLIDAALIGCQRYPGPHSLPSPPRRRCCCCNYQHLLAPRSYWADTSSLSGWRP